MKKKYINVNEKFFNQAKRLYSAGIKTDEIIELLGSSSATLNRMKRASSFEEYKEIVANSHKKPKPQQEQLKQAECITPQPSIGNIEELKSKMNELLASNKLLVSEVGEMIEAYRWVVEHAQIDMSKKRGWFNK